MKIPSFPCNKKVIGQKVLLFSAILLLWQIFAMRVNNNILIPSPFETISAVFSLLIKPTTWQSIAITLVRVIRGLSISLILSLLLLFIYELDHRTSEFFTPVVTLISSIPNISYMILAIIWLGSEGSVSVVTMMVLFPVTFQGLFSTVLDEEESLKDVQALYQESFFYRVRYHLLPMLSFTILRTMKTALQLGFKVGIMAEIVASVRSGIGRSMHFANLNLNTAEVLAWTLIIIFLSMCITALIDKLLEMRMQHEEKSG